MLKSLEYVRQCSECIDKAATHLGGIIAYQAADQARKKPFVFIQIDVRLRDRVVAKARMISWR